MDPSTESAVCLFRLAIAPVLVLQPVVFFALQFGRSTSSVSVVLSVTQSWQARQVWAVKRLHSFLYGVEFILETDHQPLLYLAQTKYDNSRVMRWALALQVYRYQIKVVKGCDIQCADFLSKT